ncbi:MAG: hypothetical protein GC160_15615 [Acidobacteria bacterium]|nr:hypothetical protein [Acidobacteriota bacterium]
MMKSEPENSPPVVRDKSPKPPGVLPKNVQAWVLIGVATVMVCVLAFSGGQSSPSGRTDPLSKDDAVTDPNAARIQEYRNRLEAEARKLEAERQRLKQATAALMTEPPEPEPEASPPFQSYGYYRPTETATPQKTALEQERERREYESLFASNVALTYREDDGPTKIAIPTNPPSQQAASPWAIPYPAVWPPSPPSTAPAQPANQPAQPQPAADRPRTVSGTNSPNRATGKQYRLFEGAWIEAVLTNRLNATFTGPVNCMVTTNVYSHDRQHILIPQGSRVLGEARRVDQLGQQRVAVSFHRIVMPDGYSVSLDQFQGLNQVGETGLKDKVNHHYMRIFGASLALGAIAGFSLHNTNQGLNQSGTDAYRAGVAQNLGQSGTRILDRFLNILPTLTIREGHRVKIYLSGDLFLPAYDRHQIPSDL